VFVCICVFQYTLSLLIVCIHLSHSAVRCQQSFASEMTCCAKGVRRILVRGVNATWGEENFENLTTKWCILEYMWINVWSWHSAVLYTCLPWLLSKYSENCSFLHVFAFYFFIHFSSGSADPICPYVRTPIHCASKRLEFCSRTEVQLCGHSVVVLFKFVNKCLSSVYLQFLV